MRIMPYRTARASTVFSRPTLQTPAGAFDPGEPIDSWDYLTPTTLRSSVTVDRASFGDETGIDPCVEAQFVVQADCPTTGFRQVAKAAITDQGRASLEVTLPLEACGGVLEVRQMIVLCHERSAIGAVAHAKGSRLASDPQSYRFMLEGHGGAFPSEAFDFSLSSSLPDDAAWHLVVRTEDLEIPYLMGVRLLVNTHHPAADEILSGAPGVVHSVLFHSVLEQLLLTVADEASDQVGREYPEESMGAVLEELCDTYLHRSLPNVVNGLKKERSRTLAQIQGATGFLRKARP